VVHDFEARKIRIEQLERRVKKSDEDLARHRATTDVIRRRWIDPVTQLIAKISANFSRYFTDMKCAGEVDLAVPPNPVCYATYCSTTFLFYTFSLS
jgi:chromosome segregation ATPase